MSDLKGAVVPAKLGMEKTVIDILYNAMKKGIFEAVIIPMRVPAKDSYAYVLIKDKSLLKDASFLPPVMFVQGAKAVSSITRLGKGKMKIAAILRPCEVRATIELAKLGQVDLENITIISMDCPGVIPISNFLENPEKNIKLFNEAATKFDYGIMRPVCKICDKSSMVSGDLHIGTLGVKKDSFLLISNGEKGEKFAEKLGINLKDDIEDWKLKAESISKEKHDKRKKANKQLKAKIAGIDNLVDNFIHCINCHNCMKVCPVCICRLCYFDSDKVKLQSQDYIEKAERKGSIRFLPDTTLFQMGRMMHMSISCVSCGSCEDACPMSIPVGQIFSMISDETQGLFDYVSGRSIEEQIPIMTYKEKELLEVEDAND
jgi:formate dehydrogenase (coenzyme F420) beta subunit